MADPEGCINPALIMLRTNEPGTDKLAPYASSGDDRQSEGLEGIADGGAPESVMYVEDLDGAMYNEGFEGVPYGVGPGAITNNGGLKSTTYDGGFVGVPYDVDIGGPGAEQLVDSAGAPAVLQVGQLYRAVEDPVPPKVQAESRKRPQARMEEEPIETCHPADGLRYSLRIGPNPNPAARFTRISSDLTSLGMQPLEEDDTTVSQVRCWGPSAQHSNGDTQHNRTRWTLAGANGHTELIGSMCSQLRCVDYFRSFMTVDVNEALRGIEHKSLLTQEYLQLMASAFDAQQRNQSGPHNYDFNIVVPTERVIDLSVEMMMGQAGNVSENIRANRRKHDRARDGKADPSTKKPSKASIKAALAQQWKTKYAGALPMPSTPLPLDELSLNQNRSLEDCLKTFSDLYTLVDNKKGDTQSSILIQTLHPHERLQYTWGLGNSAQPIADARKRQCESKKPGSQYHQIREIRSTNVSLRQQG